MSTTIQQAITALQSAKSQVDTVTPLVVTAVNNLPEGTAVDPSQIAAVDAVSAALIAKVSALNTALAEGGTDPGNGGGGGTNGSVLMGVKNPGSDPANLYAFESWIGKQVDGVLAFTDDYNWGGIHPDWMIGGYLGQTGRRILWSIPMLPNPDVFGSNIISQTASGQHDGQWTSQAQAILNYENSHGRTSGPIYVRMNWELGGGWFFWTGVAQGNGTAFVNTWRRACDAYHAVSSRFKMVFDVAGDQVNPMGWYPGDSYIDVISQDFYWNPDLIGTAAVPAFNAMRTTPWGLDYLSNFAAQHNKQFAISEWGVGKNPSGANLDFAAYVNAVKTWAQGVRPVYMTYWDDYEGSGYYGAVTPPSTNPAAPSIRTLFQQGISW